MLQVHGLVWEKWKTVGNYKKKLAPGKQTTREIGCVKWVGVMQYSWGCRVNKQQTLSLANSWYCFHVEYKISDVRVKQWIFQIQRHLRAKLPTAFLAALERLHAQNPLRTCIEYWVVALTLTVLTPWLKMLPVYSNRDFHLWCTS